MKLKIRLGSGGIKGLFTQHVEKMVLAVVLLLACLMIFLCLRLLAGECVALGMIWPLFFSEEDPYPFSVARRGQAGFPQGTFSLPRFVGQEMALVGAVPANLALCSEPKALGRASIRLHFRHRSGLPYCDWVFVELGMRIIDMFRPS